MRCKLRTIGVVCVALSVAGCGSSSTTTNPAAGGSQAGGSQTGSSTGGTQVAGASTPEEAFAAFSKAVSAENWADATKLMTRESQEGMTAGLMIALGFLTLDPDKKDSIEALFKKYGLEDGLKVEAGEFPIKDVSSFMVDAMKLLSDEDEGGGMANLGTATLSDLKVEGDTAKGTVSVEGEEPDDIEFKLVDGSWLIHMPMEGMQGGGMEIGGGDSFEWDDELWAEYENPVIDPQKAMSVAEFNKAWQFDISVSNKPAADILSTLAEEIGLKFDAGKLSDTLKKPVSLDLSKASRVQAIEEIAKQLDITPRYFPTQLKFKEGRRAVSPVFAGPFLIAMASLEEVVPYATATLKMRVYGGGLPAGIGSHFKNDDASAVIFDHVASGGQSLIDESGFSMTNTRSAGRTVDAYLDVALKNLVQKVTQLEEVKGKLNIPLATKIVEGTFEAATLEAGSKVTAGDYTFTLESFDPGDDTSVEVKYKGPEAHAVNLLAFGSDDQSLTDNSGNHFWFSGEGSFNSYFQGNVKRIVVQAVVEAEQLEYELSLADIPLTHHADMPAEIEELKFEGDIPIKIEFKEIKGNSEDNRKVVFVVTNNTNKDIQSVVFNFEYLDGNGKVLKDIPHSHSSAPVLFKAHDTSELELSAFFMPEDAVKAAGTLMELRAADATTWDAEE